MPEIITYLINRTGVDFNRLLNPVDQVSQIYFDKLIPGQPDYREGRLQGDDEYFGVDLTGSWTEIGLPYPYTALLDNDPGKAAEIRSQIRKWECKLREALPTAEIFRVSRYLFDHWKGADDESPIYDDGSIRRFLEWVQSQDKRYWSRLPET